MTASILQSTIPVDTKCNCVLTLCDTDIYQTNRGALRCLNTAIEEAYSKSF